MKNRLNNTIQIAACKGLFADILRPYRNCLPSLLLIALLPVAAIGYASAIHDASKSGDLEQVQRLIVKGTDVNEKAGKNETPLMIASLAGQGEIASYLLQRGAVIDARNTSGLTALHAAAYAGHADIVSLLVAKGAAVNDSSNRFGTSPLLLATEENHIEVVKSLLKLGADINAVEINGFNATSKAGWREHWDVLNILLANDATCQTIEIAGEWLYEECTSRAIEN